MNGVIEGFAAVMIIALVVGLILDFVPWFIALNRGMTHPVAIFFICLTSIAMCWTVFFAGYVVYAAAFVVWIAALIWACAGRTKQDEQRDEERHRQLVQATRGDNVAL